MANIRYIGMRLIEDFFDMSSGYVLDFSNRSFADFCSQELEISIYDDSYAASGISKPNRLHVFLRTAPDPLAGRALRALWEYRKVTRSTPVANDIKARQQEEQFFSLCTLWMGREVRRSHGPRQPRRVLSSRPHRPSPI